MKKRWVFLILLLGIILISTGCYPKTILRAHSSEHNVTVVSNNIEILWSRGDIYTVQSSSSISLDAAYGKMCFIGATKNNVRFSINCLNPKNGQLLWQQENTTSSKVLVTYDGVYIDANGIAGISKYDKNGGLVWSQELWGTGVESLYVSDNQLQVLTVPEKLIGLDLSNGKIVQEYCEGREAFIQNETETFIYENGLKAISVNTGNEIWHISHDQFDRSLRMAPVFSPDVIFLRTGRTRGSVYAIDRYSGEILWQTADNIISNIAYSEAKTIYILTREGILLSVDEISGQRMQLAEFSSVPFILNGERPSIGGYDLAYDDSSGMLFAILGDSRQLIAFQEK